MDPWYNHMHDWYNDPNLVKIDSLKVNVTDTVNDNPVYLCNNQYLVVGQEQYTQGGKDIYKLIVDNEGVIVNGALTMRSDIDNGNRYALAVDGNVYVSGEIIAGSCNLQYQYDPNGYFDCASASNIPIGCLVEVVGYSNTRIQVQKTSTAFSRAIFGVCTNSVRGVAGSWDGGPSYPWMTQVQTAGVATISCRGPVNIGDMLTSAADGYGQQNIINGLMVDTAIHNYTIAKALQEVPVGIMTTIRCLMNVIKAPPVNRGDGYWALGCNEPENIFFQGYVTVGSGGDYASRNNAYAVNIVQSADRSINHSQFNIENTQASQLRLALVGTAYSSPAIVNTGPATPIEFHAARTQQYFDRMYTASNWITFIDINGNYARCNIISSASDVPDYVNYASPSDAPHMIIGTDGNVGIHTCANPPLTFKVRTTANTGGIYPTLTEKMALHIQGNSFTSNMLIWDYESGMPKNIDDLYVRRLGVTFPAANVIPGPFASSGYYFPAKLGVGGEWDPNLALKVWGNSAFSKSVSIGDTLTVQNLDCVNAAFKNDVTALSDVVVAGSIRLEGGIFVSVLDSEDSYGTKHYTWEAVNFNVASSSSNQFNTIGQGLMTPGRLGTGIAPRDLDAKANSLGSQLVINKHTPNSGTNLWELELKDMTTTRYMPTAWIGHPLMLNTTRKPDASLMFATPPPADPYFAGVFDGGIDTNIYFFPGRGSWAGVSDADIPPALGVFNRSVGPRVGINTYTPESELHVEGTITFTKQIQLYNPATNLSYNIGLWVADRYATPITDGGNATPANFSGLQYNDPAAPYVGINVPPEYGTGVTLGNNLKVYGSLIDGTNSKLANWYDGSDCNTVQVTNSSAPPGSNSIIYTWNSTGIGLSKPSGDLDIKNNYNKTTTLRLVSENGINQTAIEMSGRTGVWKTTTNDTTRLMDIGYSATNTPLTTISSNVPRPLWMQWDVVNQRPHTYIGCPLDMQSSPLLNTVDPSASLIVKGGVSVVGDMKITGNYYASGFIALNYDSNVIPSSNLGVDDVYIGGGNVVMNPDGNHSVIIGNPASANESINQVGGAMLRVYQSQTNLDNTVAEFTTTQSQGLIVIKSTTTRKALKFGIFDPQNAAQSRAPFAFLDDQDQPYLSFNKAPSGVNNYVGFNTFNPQAVLHVTSQGTGNNLFRMTTTISDQSTTAECPQLVMEKAYGTTGAPPTTWAIAGPNTTYREKLAMVYSDSTTAPGGTELFAFTNNGYLGIGTTAPAYAVDMFSTGSGGGMRIANSGPDAVPQIVLQAQDPTYNNNEITSYRMYSQSNNFYLDSQSESQGLTPIYHVNDNGHIGLCMPATSNYNVTVHGVFNVTGSILLNGNTLFSTNESVAQETAYLHAVNVYLQPDQNSGGGVCVNVAKTVTTGNLFYIKGGNNKNMMVYDSPYNEAQLHFRTRQDMLTYNTWRLGTKDSSMYMELWQDSGNNLSVDDTHDLYNRGLTLSANTDSSGATAFTATINGSLTLPYQSSGISMGNTLLSTNAGDNLLLVSTGLQITGTLASSNIATYISANGVPRCVIDQSGRIGVGTTVPRASLDLGSGSSLTSNYAFSGNSNSGLALAGNASSVVVTANGCLAAIFNDTTSGSRLPALVVPSLTSTGATILGPVATPILSVTSNGSFGIFTGATGPQYPIHLNCNVVVNGSLLPQQSGSGLTMGSSASRWYMVYTSNLDISGAVLTSVGGSNIQSSAGITIPFMTMKDGTTSIVNAALSNSTSGLAYNVTGANGATTTYYPVVSQSLGAGGSGGKDTETNISSLVLKTSNADPLQAYTVVGSNVAGFHSASKSNILMVKGNGCVGVGTATPTSPLTVIGSNATGYTLTVNSANGGGLACMVTPCMTPDAGLYVSSNAYVGIGTSNPQTPLHVNGQALVQGNFIGMCNMYVNNDLVVAGNTYTHYDQVVDSDIRLKSNLARIDNALDKVCALTGYTYDMGNPVKRSTGLVAQDVLQVLPEAVGSNVSSGYYGVEYGSMMGLIVQAIKELRAEIHNMKLNF
jgi:hypothetical protein